MPHRPFQAGAGADRGEQAGGRSAHEDPCSPVLAGLAVKRRTGNPAKTAWLPTVRIRPLRTPNGHLRTKARKGRTHCQHLSTVRCWQQAGHAENGNQSNPGHLAAAVTGTAAVSRQGAGAFHSRSWRLHGAGSDQRASRFPGDSCPECGIPIKAASVTRPSGMSTRRTATRQLSC